MDIDHLKKIAKSGGLARIKKYGNPGTIIGRKRGGLNSLKKHLKERGGFKTLKIFKKPARSEELAELVGILFGDGHLSYYQASITTNSETDWGHALFVKHLIKKLFGASARLRKKRNKKAVEIVVSSRYLVVYFKKLGMPLGNKLSGGKLSVPNWVLKSNSFKKGFLRGLFDTDGSIYLDSQNTKGKKYRYISWTITSYADTLRSDIVLILKGFGMKPTLTNSQKSVYIRNRKDIEAYFKIIGSHNTKHLNRYKKFGGVA